MANVDQGDHRAHAARKAVLFGGHAVAGAPPRSALAQRSGKARALGARLRRFSAVGGVPRHLVTFRTAGDKSAAVT